MDKKIKKEIIDSLEKDEPIPAEFEDVLFPTTKKEYELKYAGKERKEVILNRTLSVPFQPVKQFGNVKDSEWHNMLIFGDNLQALKHLLKLKKDGKLRNPDGTDGVKLCYIDPPFATKQDFQGNKDQKAYSDKIAGAEFIEFLRKRFILIKDVMSSHGSLYVHLDTKKSHYIKVVLDEVFGESNFQNEIIWQRSDPHNDAKQKYGNIHDSILYYKFPTAKYNWSEITTDLSNAALKEYLWMKLTTGKIVPKKEPLPEGARLVKLERASQKGNNTKRIFEWRGAKLLPGLQWMGTIDELEDMLKKGELFLPKYPHGAQRCRVYYLDDRIKEGQVIQDIWTDVGRMKGGKGDYPTQKPEQLIERIIKASSEKGDYILDCFAGSGTLGAVSEKIKDSENNHAHRKWIMIDCGKLAIYTMQHRLMNLTEEIGNTGKPIKPKPFVLYNAGLYNDKDLVNQMEGSDYKNFVLELFGCQNREHKINGLNFHGTLNNHSVMVFDKKHFLTDEFIEDLHDTIGSVIKEEAYIIAPVGIVGFNEDYKIKGKVKYTVLRIPNSIIEYIKEMNFTRLEQPRSISDINQTIDSVGFDFVYPPKVKAKYYSQKPKGKLIDKEYVIEIEEFEPIQLGSKIVEFKDSREESIAMVMIDIDYDGDIFNLSKYFFGDEIVKNNYKLTFDDELGEKIMIIYLDIFGNERKEVLKKSDFKVK